MGKKKVVAFLAEYTGVDNFSEVLLDEEFYKPVEITSQKTTELRFIEQNHRTNLITGLFVTTQRNGIPPTHTPGQDDYSAVPLSDGQGLAYPNTILYDPTSHVLYLEINQIGISEKRICEYFSAHASRLNIANFRLTLAPVLKSEAYERVNGMAIIDSMECQIASPNQLIRNAMLAGSLGNIGELARNLNATKQISITVKAEEINGGISKHEALAIVRFFENIVQTVGFNKRNKLRYKGRKTSIENTDTLIEEDVSFFLDKIMGSFNLTEPDVATNLQYHDRKEGILNVYTQYRSEVENILGNNNLY